MYVCLPPLPSPSPMSECDPPGILMPPHKPTHPPLPAHTLARFSLRSPNCERGREKLSDLWTKFLFDAVASSQLWVRGLQKAPPVVWNLSSELKTAAGQITSLLSSHINWAYAGHLRLKYAFLIRCIAFDMSINICFWPDTKPTNEKHWQNRSLPLRFWSVRSYCTAVLRSEPPLLISTLAWNRLSTATHTRLGGKSELFILCFFILIFSDLWTFCCGLRDLSMSVTAGCKWWIQKQNGTSVEIAENYNWQAHCRMTIEAWNRNTVEIQSGTNRGGVFLRLSIMVHTAATYRSTFLPYGTRKFEDNHYHHHLHLLPLFHDHNAWWSWLSPNNVFVPDYDKLGHTAH